MTPRDILDKHTQINKYSTIIHFQTFEWGKREYTFQPCVLADISNMKFDFTARGQQIIIDVFLNSSGLRKNNSCR